MNFNLNQFLHSIANALDTIEINIFGMPTNHSKRIAYISVIIARELRLSDEEIFDLASLAILHDNGASMKILHDKLLGTIKEQIWTYIRRSVKNAPIGQCWIIRAL